MIRYIEGTIGGIKKTKKNIKISNKVILNNISRLEGESVKIRGTGYKIKEINKKIVVDVGYAQEVTIPIKHYTGRIKIENNELEIETSSPLLRGELYKKLIDIKKYNKYKGTGIYIYKRKNKIINKKQ